MARARGRPRSQAATGSSCSTWPTSTGSLSEPPGPRATCRCTRIMTAATSGVAADTRRGTGVPSWLGRAGCRTVSSYPWQLLRACGGGTAHVATAPMGVGARPALWTGRPGPRGRAEAQPLRSWVGLELRSRARTTRRVDLMSRLGRTITATVSVVVIAALGWGVLLAVRGVALGETLASGDDWRIAARWSPFGSSVTYEYPRARPALADWLNRATCPRPWSFSRPTASAPTCPRGLPPVRLTSEM